MKRKLSAAFCLLVLAVTGCADPTEDKPKATVDEPAPAPAPAPEGRRFVVSAEESSIGFVGSKITGSHDGGFNAFQGEIMLVDGDPLASSIRMTIDIDSMWSDNDNLTQHLKSPDFFDVATYPSSEFASTEIVTEGEGYRLAGNLTLHGITKSISFPATIAVEDDRVTASSEFALKRFDFGIVYPGRPDDLIRDDVLIKLELVAVPAES
jgi:polyisoprenoid-binding protein YceI